MFFLFSLKHQELFSLHNFFNAKMEKKKNVKVKVLKKTLKDPDETLLLQLKFFHPMIRKCHSERNYW